MLRPVERHSLSSQVFRQLRDDILNETYQPGDRLPSERELCDILGVNRSSVREALKRLQQAGLVEIRHGGGTVVLDFRINGGFDLLQNLVTVSGRVGLIAVRSVLEFRALVGPEIARYAARRMQEPEIRRVERIVDQMEACGSNEVERFQDLDFEFHYTMARGGENLALLLIVNSIRDTYLKHKEFFRVMFVQGIEHRRVYRQIVRALRDRNEARASQRCTTLMEGGNQAFWQWFSEVNPMADSAEDPGTEEA